jgi:hypothetical protein
LCCSYLLNCWPSLFKLFFLLLILVELLTITQQFLQYKQNIRKFKQWWSTIPLISTKQKKV